MNERILVLVRAIPEKSERYGYSICVAGLNEKSEWRRLYPFQFSYGERLVDFGKKDLINVTLADPDNDKRRESRKVTTHENLKSPLNDEEILQRIIPLVFSIEKLNKEDASLGVIKPELTGIDVKINSTEIYDGQTYFSVAGDYLEKREKVKMPVELRYQFKCKNEPECKGHNIILIDWELNELARNVMRNEKDKKIIENKIKFKFFDFMKTRDLYFLMGTHFRFSTWIIIGLFYPQKRKGIQLKFNGV
ncbi:hypothetical protein DOJK_01191 [Patescibacteria group bacterium]|nr:hypothetical protein DOJK_01191 [Patescibacteria group bacterium]